MKVVELFAGVGGFRIGLERTNQYEVIWSNQWEPNKTKQHAFDCYQERFKKGIHMNENIEKIEAKDIPNHDLLVGGFPCQDYSVARTKANGLQGKKGVLFWEIIRIIHEKKPKYVLLENVDRLLKSPAKQRGRDFGIMLSALWKEGYAVEWRVINAADYGHPQRRRRVFIFAYSKETNYYQQMKQLEQKAILNEEGFFREPFPVLPLEESNKKQFTFEIDEDLIKMTNEFQETFFNSGIMIEGKGYTYETESLKEKEKTISEILEKNVLETYYLGEKLEKWEYLKGAKEIPRISQSGHSYLYKEGPVAFPDSLDKPARTMLTSESSVNRSTHVICDPETNRLRKLTPVECERLNEFPDNWTNTGMPEKFRYFVMGNALVTGLVEKMGKKLHKINKG